MSFLEKCDPSANIKNIECSYHNKSDRLKTKGAEQLHNNWNLNDECGSTERIGETGLDSEMS